MPKKLHAHSPFFVKHGITLLLHHDGKSNENPWTALSYDHFFDN